jgi:hypothetical protein
MYTIAILLLIGILVWIFTVFTIQTYLIFTLYRIAEPTITILVDLIGKTKNMPIQDVISTLDFAKKEILYIKEITSEYSKKINKTFNIIKLIKMFKKMGPKCHLSRVMDSINEEAKLLGKHH